MARITWIDNNVDVAIYLKELDHRQRQVIFPPGQDRYIRKIDLVALQAALTDAASPTLAAAFVAGTVGADDISLANITTVAAVALPPDVAQELQDLISYRIIETGNFLLSLGIPEGQLAQLVDQGKVKVFVDDGSALYVI